MTPAASKTRRTVLTAVAVACACLLFASAAAAESRLYWTNNASGSIATANRAGGEVIQKLFFASPEPYGIAADSTHVYWTDEGTDEIGRAELNGANVEPSLIPVAGEVPEGMAIDAGHIYWANLVGQAIGRANLDGSNPEPNFVQLSAASFPEGVAIEGSHIYWTSAGHGGEIGRSNLDGGEVEEELITGLGGAISALAADATHLYWSTNVGVGRANIDGTEVEPTLVTGQTSVGGVAVDNEHVFWTSFTTNRIGRAELDGGTPEPAFITGAEAPDTIAVSKNATETSGAVSAPTTTPTQGVEETATVSGGETTSGQIVFSLYGPEDETCAGAALESFSVVVSGNGTYHSPTVTPSVPGTYHWEASYSGDAINEASASTCQAGTFTVPVAKTEPSGNPTPSPAGEQPSPPAIAPPGVPIVPQAICTSSRTVTIHWLVPRRVHLTGGVLTINGRQSARLSSHARSALVSFVGFHDESAAVKISMHARDGRGYSLTRVFHPCSGARSGGGPVAMFLRRGAGK